MSQAPGSFDLMAAFGLGLSRLDRDLRAFSLGGSDVNAIAAVPNKKDSKAYDSAMWKVRNLIAVKRGEREPDDLSRNTAVILGIWTEPLNAWLYEQFTGTNVFSRNSTVEHEFHPEYRCSLDGRVVLSDEEGDGLWEAKWTSMTNLETVTNTYLGQLQHNLDVCGRDYIVLSVLMGSKFEHVVVRRDQSYINHLRARTDMVWEAIQSESGELAEDLPPMPKPVMPTVFLKSAPVDLTQIPHANEIGSLAPDFLRTYGAAKVHTKVVKQLKELMPEDAQTMEGFGLKATRNAAGSLSLIPAPANDDKASDAAE